MNLGEKLSSYTARHTWATTAYQKKCATGVICNALGHSSIKVTETYLKAFEQKEIDRTNRMIISYVKQEAEKANKNRNILFNTLYFSILYSRYFVGNSLHKIRQI